MNRRNFIKNMAVTVGSISPLLKIGGGLSLVTSNLLASESSAPTDGYKAIVIINLDGGNDAMNTFPPTAETAHAQYKEIRDNLGVSREDLSLSDFYTVDAKGHYSVPPGGESGDKQPYWSSDWDDLGSEGKDDLQYIIGSYHAKTVDEATGKRTVPTGLGIHAFMPEIAALYDNKKLSIVSNLGTLIEPTTKADIANNSVQLPPFLFSHLHQYRSVSYLNSDADNKTGWAGRLADSWNIDGALGLNLSLTSGGMILFNGTKTKGLKLSGVNGVPTFPNPDATHELLKDIETIDEINPFKRVYNKRMSDAANFADAINDVLETTPEITYTSVNSYGDALFDTGGDNLAFRNRVGMRTHHGLKGTMFNALSDTAQMINITDKGFGYKRQIFSISEAGYDFHGGQLGAHTKKLRALSMAVGDFYKALEDMGMQDKVLVVLSSEFGRTMKSNSDGTDHGWGGHGFMLCGDPKFNGGNVFGTVMDNLELDGPNAHTNRARIIPTTSIEQMMAPALKWFGVEDEATMAHVFPNLVNFRTDTDDTESAFLQGVFS